MRDEPKAKDDASEAISPAPYASSVTAPARELKSETPHTSAKKISDQILEQMPVLALVKNLQGRYFYVNQTFNQVGPGGMEDFVGKTDRDVYPAETAVIISENDRAAISSGRTLECLEILPTPNGPRLYLVLRFPIHEKGRLAYLGAAAIDITGHEPAESPLPLSTVDKKLRKKIKARLKLESKLRKQTNELTERVRELNCLYRISELTSQPGLKLDKMLKSMVKIIANAWRYPSVTCVRIILDGQVHATSNFKITPWRQQMEITADNGQRGSIEVCYLEEKPEADEGPFLKEQRWLLEVIAARLKTALERKWTEEELKRLNNLYMTEHSHRKYVSKRLIELLEEDRRRVARDLHDHVGQILTTLKMDIEMLRARTSGSEPDIARDAERAGRKIDDIMKEVKNIGLGLRPSILEDLGLIPSLRALFNEMTDSTGVRFHFFSEDIPVRFDPQRELAVFRIIQEAATNALKHSKAAGVFVNLTRRDEIICLSVEDNGQGFDPKAAMTGSRMKNSLGLMLMNERAVQMGGFLSIDAKPGRGTLVMAEIPISINDVLETSPQGSGDRK